MHSDISLRTGKTGFSVKLSKSHVAPACWILKQRSRGSAHRFWEPLLCRQAVWRKAERGEERWGAVDLGGREGRRTGGGRRRERRRGRQRGCWSPKRTKDREK